MNQNYEPSLKSSMGSNDNPPSTNGSGYGYIPQPYPANENGYGYPPQPPKKKKTGLIIGIVAAVLLILAVIGSIGEDYAQRRSQKKRSQEKLTIKLKSLIGSRLKKLRRSKSLIGNQLLKKPVSALKTIPAPIPKKSSGNGNGLASAVETIWTIYHFSTTIPPIY